MPLLEMKHISKSFAGVYANEDVSLSVERGEIHALLGENGAGKTTLMNILFGIYQADSGEICYKGEPVQFHSPGEAIDHGIGMVHQHFSLVKKMSVLDNIILGLEQKGAILDRAKAKVDILCLTKTYGLQVDPDAKIQDLSVGEQQRVEILKSLYRNVNLLILDEPTGVLTPQETENFFDVLRRLKNEGYGIIIITHRLAEIMAISDRVTILRDGKQVKDLSIEETTPEELSAYMIGRQLKTEIVEKKETVGGTALVMSHISLKKRHGSKKLLDDINLELRKGEILGVAGVEGNGQKELAEVITGIQKITEGELWFEDQDIQRIGVRERFKKGISYISDDRHHDSLVMDMSVTDNMILREYGSAPYSKNGILNKKAAEASADAALSKYRIKTSGTSGIGALVKLMSGGNQQKVILAREISESANLVVASQPTRGLDIGATEFVHEVLMEERNKNKSVLLISADLDEILSVSDRIAVMYEGKIIGIMNREDADIHKIGLLMGGVAEEEQS